MWAPKTFFTSQNTSEFAQIRHRHPAAPSASTGVVPDRQRAFVRAPCRKNMQKCEKWHKITSKINKKECAHFFVLSHVLSHVYACAPCKNSGSHRQKWSNVAAVTPDDPNMHPFWATSRDLRPPKSACFLTRSTFLEGFRHGDHAGVVGFSEFARQKVEIWRFMGQNVTAPPLFQFFGRLPGQPARQDFARTRPMPRLRRGESGVEPCIVVAQEFAKMWPKMHLCDSARSFSTITLWPLNVFLLAIA